MYISCWGLACGGRDALRTGLERWQIGSLPSLITLSAKQRISFLNTSVPLKEGACLLFQSPWTKLELTRGVCKDGCLVLSRINWHSLDGNTLKK